MMKNNTINYTVLTFTLFSSSAFSQVDTTSFASAVGSCEGITQVASQRAGGDFKRAEALRALSRKFMNTGMQLNAKNSDDGVAYINAKGVGYQNAMNASDAQLEASVSRCQKIAK